VLAIVIIGVAIFFMAFLGINRFFPTVFGLGAVVGLIFGLYFIWLGLAGSNENSFGWGCVLMVVSAALLIFIKTSFSD
jgi:hypothetical protein